MLSVTSRWVRISRSFNDDITRSSVTPASRPEMRPYWTQVAAAAVSVSAAVIQAEGWCNAARAIQARHPMATPKKIATQ